MQPTSETPKKSLELAEIIEPGKIMSKRNSIIEWNSITGVIK